MKQQNEKLKNKILPEIREVFSVQQKMLQHQTQLKTECIPHTCSHFEQVPSPSPIFMIEYSFQGINRKQSKRERGKHLNVV